ncbi:MAG: ankyrin repeat domain-containing protein, partial [Anaerolineae bacterium]|nr:ankyrin repeat domain-containing protein [Anaerolineae bacterium]
IAAKHGNTDKVDFLLRAGADPHFRNADGYTPLLHAVYGQTPARRQVVRQLLNAGADPVG